MKFKRMAMVLIVFLASVLALAQPMTVTGVDGVSVSLARSPQRIVALAPSDAEILFSLGAGDRLVGVNDWADYPPEVLRVEKIGGFPINHEKILSLQPDLIVANSSMVAGDVEALRKLGLPVLAIAPSNLTQVMADFRLLATVLGVDPTEVIAPLEARIAAVEAQAQAWKERGIRVFVEIWHDPLMTAGPGSFIDDLIRVAGGRNIAYDLPGSWESISQETILVRDPQVLIVFNLDPQEMASSRVWKGINGVRNGRVHSVYSDPYIRPGARLVDALEELASILQEVK